MTQKRIRLALIGLAGLVCLLSVLVLPSVVPTHSHDLEGQAALEYWVKSGFRFGVDIIQNVGPYGYVQYPSIYSGFIAWEKLIASVVLAVVFVGLFFDRIRQAPRWQQFAALVAVYFYCIADVYIYVLMLLAMYASFSPVVLLSVFSSLLLSFLALSKGTCLILSIAIVTLSSFSRMRKMPTVQSATPFLSYLVGLLFFWWLSGQDIRNFGSFVLAMFRFSNGYNQAMAEYGPENLVLTAAITFACLSVLILKVRLAGFRLSLQWIRSCEIEQPLLALCELFILFIIWKHSFVRADMHMVFFFQYSLIFFFVTYAGATVQLLHRSHSFKRNAGKIVVVAIIPAIQVLSLALVTKESPVQAAVDFTTRVQTTGSELLRLPGHFDALQPRLDRLVQDVQLKEFAPEVADAKTGYFGMFPGPLLYSGLHYTPSPSTISFAAWNEWIMQSDRAFYENETTAPPYVVYDLKSIDSRLAAQDDSLTQLSLLTRYSVVERLEDVVLLKRRSHSVSPEIGRYSSSKAKLGEWISLPEGSEPVWVSFTLHDTVLSKFLGILYKPPVYKIDIKFAGGSVESYRVIPQMAQVGFLLRPFISSNEQFLLAHALSGKQNLATGLTMPRVEAFKIRSHKLKFAAADSMDVSLATVHNLDIQSDISESFLYRYTAHLYGFKGQLMRHVSPSPVTEFVDGGHQYYRFTANSRLEFLKTGDMKRLQCHYKLPVTYYDTAIKSAGVRLDVVWLDASGVARTLRSIDLDPLRDVKTYSEASLDLPLPQGEGRLVLEVNHLPSSVNQKAQLLLRGVELD